MNSTLVQNSVSFFSQLRVKCGINLLWRFHFHLPQYYMNQRTKKTAFFRRAVLHKGVPKKRMVYTASVTILQGGKAASVFRLITLPSYFHLQVVRKGIHSMCACRKKHPFNMWLPERKLELSEPLCFTKAL